MASLLPLQYRGVYAALDTAPHKYLVYDNRKEGKS
jgi:hypothetical protein